MIAVPAEMQSHWAVRRVIAPHVQLAADNSVGIDGRLSRTASGPSAVPVLNTAALSSPAARDAFCTAVFAHCRLRHAGAQASAARDLQAAHAREKYLLMANDPNTYRQLGRMIAGKPETAVGELARSYRATAIRALAAPAPRGRHVSALEHMAGYFKRDLDAAARGRIHGTIADFRAGVAPLPYALAEIRTAAQRTGRTYILNQSYLAPQPLPMLLTNWL